MYRISGARRDARCQHRTSDLAPMDADVLQHPIVERLQFRAHQPRMSLPATAGPESGDGGCNPRKPADREWRIAVPVIQSEHRFLPGHVVAAQLCDVQIAAVLRYAGVRLRL